MIHVVTHAGFDAGDLERHGHNGLVSVCDLDLTTQRPSIANRFDLSSRRREVPEAGAQCRVEVRSKIDGLGSQRCVEVSRCACRAPGTQFHRYATLHEKKRLTVVGVSGGVQHRGENHEPKLTAQAPRSDA